MRAACSEASSIPEVLSLASSLSFLLSAFYSWLIISGVTASDLEFCSRIPKTFAF